MDEEESPDPNLSSRPSSVLSGLYEAASSILGSSSSSRDEVEPPEDIDLPEPENVVSWGYNYFAGLPPTTIELDSTLVQVAELSMRDSSDPVAMTNQRGKKHIVDRLTDPRDASLPKSDKSGL
jgi:hypothetical protein